MFSECGVVPMNHYCSVCKKVLVCTMCKVQRGYEDLNPYPCVTCDENVKDKPANDKVNETNDLIDSNDT